MARFHDDNFGDYHDTNDPDVVEFYERNQRQSVSKVCVICDRRVRILPQYDKCDACCQQIELGMDW